MFHLVTLIYLCTKTLYWSFKWHPEEEMTSSESLTEFLLWKPSLSNKTYPPCNSTNTGKAIFQDVFLWNMIFSIKLNIVFSVFSKCISIFNLLDEMSERNSAWAAGLTYSRKKSNLDSVKMKKRIIPSFHRRIKQQPKLSLWFLQVSTFTIKSPSGSLSPASWSPSALSSAASCTRSKRSPPPSSAPTSSSFTCSRPSSSTAGTSCPPGRSSRTLARCCGTPWWELCGTASASGCPSSPSASLRCLDFRISTCRSVRVTVVSERKWVPLTENLKVMQCVLFHVDQR